MNNILFTNKKNNIYSDEEPKYMHKKFKKRMIADDFEKPIKPVVKRKISKTEVLENFSFDNFNYTFGSYKSIYICPYCKTAYAKKSLLVDHCKLHMNVMSCTNKPCGISLNNKSNLLRNCKSHSLSMEVSEKSDFRLLDCSSPQLIIDSIDSSNNIRIYKPKFHTDLQSIYVSDILSMDNKKDQRPLLSPGPLLGNTRLVDYTPLATKNFKFQELAFLPGSNSILKKFKEDVCISNKEKISDTLNMQSVKNDASLSTYQAEINHESPKVLVRSYFHSGGRLINSNNTEFESHTNKCVETELLVKTVPGTKLKKSSPIFNSNDFESNSCLLSTVLKPCIVTINKGFHSLNSVSELTNFKAETPQKTKYYRQLHLNGHAYTYLGLKCSTRLFYCTLNRPQPMYVTQQQGLSMYSNWKICNEVCVDYELSLYDSRHRSSQYTLASSQNFDILTHSSTKSWNSVKKNKSLPVISRGLFEEKLNNNEIYNQANMDKMACLDKNSQDITLAYDEISSNAPKFPVYISSYQSKSELNLFTEKKMQSVKEKSTHITQNNQIFGKLLNKFNLSRFCYQGNIEDLDAQMEKNAIHNNNEHFLSMSSFPGNVIICESNIQSTSLKKISHKLSSKKEIIPNYNSSSLLDHGRNICPVCQKVFNKPSQLRLHINIHYFERPFRCDNCAVSFRTKGHLVKHQRSISHQNKISMTSVFGAATVNNPRPFKCADCKIAFRIHGHLAKHLRSKMHIMKLECLGKLPFGTYAEIERSGINLNDIDTTDCDNSLSSLQALAEKLNNKSTNKIEEWNIENLHDQDFNSEETSSDDDLPDLTNPTLDCDTKFIRANDYTNCNIIIHDSSYNEIITSSANELPENRLYKCKSCTLSLKTFNEFQIHCFVEHNIQTNNVSEITITRYKNEENYKKNKLSVFKKT